MLHDAPVLALAFSRDSELLASGDQQGRVKVWRVRTGQCLRRFDSAHSQGVTSLAISRDGTQVLSSSYDTLVRCVRWALGGRGAERPAKVTPSGINGQCGTGQLFFWFVSHTVVGSRVQCAACTLPTPSPLPFLPARTPGPCPCHLQSAGADATVRVWDAKSCDCTFVFRPPQASATGEAPVVGVLLNPQNVDQMLVCPRGPTLYLMTLQGQVGGVQG